MGCGCSTPTAECQYTITTNPHDDTSPHYHNRACQVFQPLEVNEDLLVGFKYVIWLAPGGVIGRHQVQCQDMTLRYVQEAAKIFRFKVFVKSVDNLGGTIANNPADEEKRFYLDMLSQNTKEDLYRLWNARFPPGNRSKLKANSVDGDDSSHNKDYTPQSIQSRISVFLSTEEFRDTPYSDIKNNLEILLVAAAAQHNQEIPLEDYMKETSHARGENSMPDVMPQSKLSAQFILQSLAAFQSWRHEGPVVPTICVSILPGRIPESAFSSIKREFLPAYEELKKISKARQAGGRTDRYSLGLLSFGPSGSSEQGLQWRSWDDEHKSKEDVVDHLHVPQENFFKNGPGEKFGTKILLGPVDRHEDAKTNLKGMNHGYVSGDTTDGSSLTASEYWNCVCRISTGQQDTGKHEPK
ncbi:hypothetical protein FSARC_7381 [Fusarium sarcochroum]|uniref:Uncharacterized protein n=1 Tax=Fusarium sarcochroum TaxID=1208366 RepID=A0A8H4TVG4_9HYPO|nr:hypothetical protein FSARC_7381 [Fusarium sarcochroum]